jgi:hypothetical protein
LAETQSRELTSQIIANRQEMMAAMRELRLSDYEDTNAYM